MTLDEAVEKINKSGSDLVAHIRKWGMGDTIFVGISPFDHPMGIFSYKGVIYIEKRNEKWGFAPVIFAGGESPAFWFDDLKTTTDFLICFLKLWQPIELE